MKRFLRLLFALIASMNYEVGSLETAALIGGREAESAQARYLVSLQRGAEHFCGGGILGDEHVISAAHCFINEDDEFDGRRVRVVAGVEDLRADQAPPAEAEVEKVYVPKEYSDAGWTTSVPLGDIAVLKLNQSLGLHRNKNLKKLRLPRKHHSGGYSTYEGALALTGGFGWDRVRVKTRRNHTEYEVGSSTDRLYSARARVVSNADCQDYYSEPIRGAELCARVSEHEDDTPQGVCRGDSGGPLVYRLNTIIGVVSGVSIGCNENNQPGIYCRVSSYVGFIRDAIRDVTDDMRTKTF